MNSRFSQLLVISAMFLSPGVMFHADSPQGRIAGVLKDQDGAVSSTFSTDITSKPAPRAAVPRSLPVSRSLLQAQ